MHLHWHCSEPGGELVRRLTVPLGVEMWARAAARHLGWTEHEPLTWFDSDGLALGGIVPHQSNKVE